MTAEKKKKHYSLELQTIELIEQTAQQYKISQSAVIDKLAHMFLAREINQLSLSLETLDELNRVYIELIKQGTNLNQITRAINLDVMQSSLPIAQTILDTHKEIDHLKNVINKVLEQAKRR